MNSQLPFEPVPIRQHLADRLPGYMLSISLKSINQLPFTANGKVDDTALLQIDESAQYASAEASLSGIEATVADIWAKILSVRNVGRSDRFQTLGGSSLQAIEVSHDIAERFDLKRHLRQPLSSEDLAAYSQVVRRLLSHEVSLPEQRAKEFRPDGFVSVGQQQVLFLEHLGEAWRAYTYHARVDLRGTIDRLVLRKAVAGVVARHRVLRMRYYTEDGEFRCKASNSIGSPLDILEVEGTSATFRRQQAEKLVEQILAKRVPVDIAPLARWTLISYGTEMHIVLQTEHHAIHDGVSSRLLLRDLVELYNAHLQGRPPALPPVIGSYEEFCAEEARWLKSDDCSVQLQQWKARLRGHSNLMAVASRPMKAYSGGQVRRKLSSALMSSISSAACRLGITSFAFTFGICSALCSSISGEEVLLMGTALANRSDKRYQNTVGMFVNTVIVPVACPRKELLKDFLERVSSDIEFVLVNGRIPLSVIAASLQSPSLGTTPFSFAYSFQDADVQYPTFKGLRMEVKEGLANGSSKFDLNVVCILKRRGTSKEAEMVFEFSDEIFKRIDAERAADQYLAMLQQSVADIMVPLQDLLPPLTGTENQIAKEPWQQNISDYAQSDRLKERHTCDVADVERKIATIWCNVLKSSRPGNHDNFFALGGHSLSALQIASRLTSLLGKPVTLRDIFLFPTIASLAEKLSTR